MCGCRVHGKGARFPSNIDVLTRHVFRLGRSQEENNGGVALEGLGEVDLKLGADKEQGQNKTIMTLFDCSERSKPIEMNGDAELGASITVNMRGKM